MKKIILIALCFWGSLLSGVANAQSFTVQADTVWATVTGAGAVYDSITAPASVSLHWRVTASDFPTDWLADNAFGICDANLCRQNTGGQLWNGTSGTTYTCTYPGPAGTAHTFDLSLDLTSVTSHGRHYASVTISDNATFYSKTITFVINNDPAAVTDLHSGMSGLRVFPNPAQDQAHVVFNMAVAGKVQLSVYDAAGRSVYNAPGQQMNAGSQQISFSTANMTTGIYNVVVISDAGTLTRQLSVVR